MGIEHLVRPVLHSMRAGQHRIVCPSCGQQRKKKTDRTMSIRIDADGAAFNCWHCQESGVISNREQRPTWQAERRMPLAVAPKKNWQELTEEGIAFLKSRGISVETAKKLGVKSAKHYIQAAGQVVDCIVFPYLNKGQEYAAKIRATGMKGFSSHGAPASLWNLHNFEDNDWLIICEGEMDAMTLVEAGYPGATSIPLGAVLKVADSDPNPQEDGKFRFIWDAKDRLERASRIVICCDADAPGQAAAEEIARRIGRDRVWVVEYPEGCKDANDVWLKRGQDGVDDLIANCKPWPISGLYDSGHFFDQVDEIYDKGMGSGESTGYRSIDELYSIAPGMLTVVTGHPSSGKSELIDQIMVNLSQSRGWTHGVCSFENEPRLHIAKLISKYMRKPFFDGPSDRLTPEELQIGKDFIKEHFCFVYQADGAMASLDSILERLKVAVMRYGIRTAVIDPYNYIEKHRDMAETEWISQMLTKVRLFAQAHGIHVWFIAHPAKMMRSTDGKVPPPGGYDISGCHDAETEVLTDQGWVPHPELTINHKVAAFDPVKDMIHYEHPSHVHVYPYEGIMHHWTGDNLDMMVTPNHRMVAKRKPKDEFSFITSEEIAPGRWYIPASSGGLDGGSDAIASTIDLGYEVEDLMWFMGFWVAEGCVQMNSLSVCQAEDQHEKPKEVMDRLGLTYTDAISNGRFNEKRMWVARLLRRWHIDLIDMVIEQCGSGARNKRVPPMLWDMTITAKYAFLEGYWYGDGSQRDNSRQAYTISPQLADDIQRLAIECGFFTAMRKDYSDNPKWADRYCVTWRDQCDRSIQIDRNLHYVEYTGNVYCVTVSTGAYVTRRNGKVAYQGNSAAWFAKADHGLTVHRPDPMHSPVAEVISWKSRFSWLGRQGKTELLYNRLTSNYMEPTDDPNPTPNAVFDPFADIGAPPRDMMPEWMREEDEQIPD